MSFWRGLGWDLAIQVAYALRSRRASGGAYPEQLLVLLILNGRMHDHARRSCYVECDQAQHSGLHRNQGVFSWNTSSRLCKTSRQSANRL